MHPARDPAMFDVACRRCERLAAHLDDVRRRYPDYHAAPVPPFGAARARLLIVGLAPGMHGANASGRPFTGDHAGILLFRTLHRFGFASQPQATGADDGLELVDCRITNAVKCLPPHNKPLPAEIASCRAYLAAELEHGHRAAVVIALGRVAHDTVLRALGAAPKPHPFAHAAEHRLDGAGLTLLDSYHCSRYNTQTGRLTASMFEAVFARARALLDAEAA